MRRPLLPIAMACVISAGVHGPALADDEPESDVGEITVVATRSRQLVRDQAIRVEVVPQEELEEAQTVAPGNLTNLLNELAGAHMENGSAGLGGTALRLRGLPGRHAQILSDGLALGGAQSDSYSFLQSPPLDLQRVELIKGVASALYGGSAVAGVLNLVSRAPDDELDLLVNQTSLGGTDVGAFFSGPPGAAVGYTLTASANYQRRDDPDRDGWSELPGYERLSLRPRWFWHDDGRTGFATLGMTAENRDGGMRSFGLGLDTRRVDGGYSFSAERGPDATFNAKVYGTVTRHQRVNGGARIDDDATNLAAEANYQARAGAHEWTLGAALQYDSLAVAHVDGVGHAYRVPAIYAQDEFSPTSWLSTSTSVRVDYNDEFGTFVSPRLSALFRLDPDLALRASVGTGYAPATSLVEEIDETGFGVLDPLRGLHAERASSASLDLTWVAKPFDVNFSVFGSEIRHALDVEETTPGRVAIVNDRRPFRARGAELLIGCVVGDAHLLANTTWLDASEEAPTGGRRDAELLPTVTSELAAIFELEGRGRAGFEISYTGSQAVFDDPYRSRAPSRIDINALAELTFGRISLFVNAFNLLDTRQQDDDPLLRPDGAPGLGGTPVVSAWAPLVGRNFNLGLRAKL